MRALLASVTSLFRLSCDAALRRIDEYVDRTLSTEELRQVEAHLNHCLHCAEQFRFEVTLVQGIRARIQRLALPPNLLRDIRSRLRAESAMPRYDA